MTGKLFALFKTYGKVTIVGILILVFIVSIAVITDVATPDKLRVRFLDVGQGDSILIQTPGGHSMLIDGGPNGTVMTRLGSYMDFFDNDIEVVIATHGDADHVTGLIPVFEKYEIGMVVRSPIDAQTGIFDDLARHVNNEDAQVRIGERGDVIDFGDGVTVHVLYPNKFVSPKLDTNDASVSIVLMYGDHSFLLTGDITSKYEPKLLGQKLPRHVTVYKAAHHGSKTSSSVPLLAYIKPEYTVISAGKDNRYGHPASEALERLSIHSKEILSTVDRGTISFISDGRLLEVQTEK